MRGKVDYKCIYNFEHIRSVIVISLVSLYYLESSYTAVSYYHLAVNDLLKQDFPGEAEQHILLQKIIVENFGNQMPF